MSDLTFHQLLLQSFHRVNREVARQITQVGLLPGQPKILEFLLTHDGCTQKDIGAGCVLDKSTVTSLLKRMQTANLILRKPHPEDQRSLRIYLTPMGREKAHWVRSLFAHLDTQALAGLTPSEQEQFFRTFSKIIANQSKLHSD